MVRSCYLLEWKRMLKKSLNTVEIIEECFGKFERRQKSVNIIDTNDAVDNFEIVKNQK